MKEAIRIVLGYPEQRTLINGGVDGGAEATKSAVDIAEFSAPVDATYPLQYVSFAEMSKDPGLKFDAGLGTGASRHWVMSCPRNVQAGRIVFGRTYSDPGNWTSWPPHEHAAMLEEMYVYFDMSAPAFALQLVYNNTEYPELVVPVREGDAVFLASRASDYVHGHILVVDGGWMGR